MEFYEDRENSVARSDPKISGAIFMSNRSTKKECFRRKLFGLPPSQANVVQNLKAGMALFLFEHEERKLYGVFQASSDGAMNIVPQAFRSSGRQFSAQIYFETIWYCHPLSEHEFCHAIKDNYYTEKKFNFGLSVDQVRKLLKLFRSRKVKTEQIQNLVTGSKVLKQSGSSDFASVRVTEEDRFVTVDRIENDLNIDDEPVNLTKYPSLLRSNLNLSGYSNNHIVETDDSMVEGQHRLFLTVPQSMDPRVSDILSSTSCRNIGNQHGSTLYDYPYHFGTAKFQYGHSSSIGMDHNTSAQELASYSNSTAGCLFPFSRSQLIPSHVKPEKLNTSPTRHSSLGDATDSFFPFSRSQLIPSYVEPKALNVSPTRHCHLDVNHESYKGLSFHDLSVASMPSSKNLNIGRENINSSSFAFSPGKGPSHVPSHGYPAASQHEYGCEGPQYWNYEPSTATIPLSSEDQSHLQKRVYPSEVQNVDCYEGQGHDGPTYHDNEDYRTLTALHSDTQNRRTSVFSRLTVAQDAIVRDDDDYVDERYNMDMLGNHNMEVLHQSQTCRRKMTKKTERFISWQDDDGDDHFENITQMLMNEDASLDSEEETGSSDRTAEVIPVVNFKRRSEIRKVLGQTERRGCIEGVESEGLSGSLRKRRKLVRPSFCNNDPSNNKSIISDSCSIVRGCSQEILEGKVNARSGATKVSNDGDEGKEKGLSENVGAPNVVYLVSCEGDDCKTEKGSFGEDSKVEGVPRELVGTGDCCPNVHVSSQEISEGKGNVIRFEALVRRDGGQDIEKGSSQNIGAANVVYPISCDGNDGKTEKSSIGEDSKVEGAPQELVGTGDCSPNAHGSSQEISEGKGNVINFEALVGRDGGQNIEKGLSQSVGATNVVYPVSCEGNDGKTEKGSIGEDSKVEGAPQELVGTGDCYPNVHGPSQEISEGNRNVISFEASVRSDGGQDIDKGLSQNVDIETAFCPGNCDGKNGNAEGSAGKGSKVDELLQQLFGVDDSYPNVQGSSQEICEGKENSESCEAFVRSNGGEHSYNGLSQNVGIQNTPDSCGGETCKTEKGSSNKDSETKGPLQELVDISLESEGKENTKCTSLEYNTKQADNKVQEKDVTGTVLLGNDGRQKSKPEELQPSNCEIK